MKQISAIFFSIVLLLSIFGQGITVLRYYIHKKYIASELCENRNKPILNCDGKCILSQKLKAQEKQQEDAGLHITEKFEILSLNIEPFNLPELNEALCSNCYNLYHSKALPIVFSDIFCPPDNA